MYIIIMAINWDWKSLYLIEPENDYIYIYVGL